MGFFLGILQNTPEFLLLPCFRTTWTGYIRSWGNLEVDIIFLCIISWWVCALRPFFSMTDRYWFSELICNVAVLPIFVNITNRFVCLFFFFSFFINKLLIKFARFFIFFFLISSLSLELTHYVWVYVQLYIGIFAHLFTKSFNFVVLKIFYTDAFASLFGQF